MLLHFLRWTERMRPHKVRKNTKKNTFEKWLNHLETYSQNNAVANENRERSASCSINYPKRDYFKRMQF